MRSPLHDVRQRRRQNERGSILVVCMVLAGMGTIGVAAWVSLLDARANQVEANISAMERRAVERNSRALAYHALYQNHLAAGSSLDTPATYTLPDNLGSCTVGAYPSAPLAEENSLRVSVNGITPVRSYTTDVTVDVPDGTGTSSWQYQMRSYSPVLGGNLLVIRPPLDYENTAPLVNGNLLVEGRAVFWDALGSDLAGGFRANEVLLPEETLGSTTLTAPGGGAVLPLNYPFPRKTSGVDHSGEAYNGALEIFDASPNPQNSYRQRALSSGISQVLDGTVVTSDGDGPDTRPPTASDSTVANIIATEEADELAEELEDYRPLSSQSLLRVLRKTNPPLNESQLLDVFDDQGFLPLDVLIELAGTYDDRLGEAAEVQLGQANQTRYTSNGNGRVTVFLARSPLPHLVIENITELRVIGQDDATEAAAAASLPPRILLVSNDATTQLAEVDLVEQNARPVVLAIASDEAAPATTRFAFDGATTFPEWHALLELRHTTAEFDTSAVSEAIVIGGIRSNQRLDVTSGSLRIKQQFEPRGLEALLGRDAWIEAYRL